jgi:PAS domain S-box-containing protein
MKYQTITTKKDEWQSRLARHDLILQSINEGVLMVNSLQKITFANASAIKMLAWKADQLIGQNCRIIFGVQADEAILFPIQFALDEGETAHVQTETFYRPDGTSFLVEYFCVPIWENNEIVAAVLTFEDISERRDLENALETARKSALESAQAKADFLANMSHEIRTPLNGIIGITDLLAATSLDTEQTKYLDTLQTSATLLLEIVNDILDFSKIEAHKLELEAIDFDLSQIIAETIQIFAPEAVKKRVQLKFELEKDLGVLRTGDAGRLRQILNNLVGNALKFTQDGEVFIKVCEVAEFLRFEVSDTGIGIEKSKQAQIFEPFMQGDISTTRNFGGTGLGLTISKQLVQLMGGEIGVESEIGKGSTFWFTAKFEKQTSLASKIAGGLQSLRRENSREFSVKPKILVVEDNQINREVALGRLRQFGIIADVAENGLEAVQAVQTRKYDLILMDCRMPEMDGFEATKQIRQMNGNAQKVKIIAMTASVTLGEQAGCLAAGMDDYLPKPMTIEALGELLQKHLRLNFSPDRLDAETNIGQHPFAQIIDEKTLTNFLEIEARGEKNFTKEMLDVFLRHTELQLAELKDAFLTRNWQIVKNKAHSLKGSSGNIGITDLFQSFQQLEKEVARGDWLKLEKLIEKIGNRVADIKDRVSPEN